MAARSSVVLADHKHAQLQSHNVRFIVPLLRATAVARGPFLVRAPVLRTHPRYLNATQHRQSIFQIATSPGLSFATTITQPLLCNTTSRSRAFQLHMAVFVRAYVCPDQHLRLPPMVMSIVENTVECAAPVYSILEAAAETVRLRMRGAIKTTPDAGCVASLDACL